MTIKRKITIAIEKRKKDGVLITENVPIRARVVYNGGRVELFTGTALMLPNGMKQKKRYAMGVPIS